MLCVIATVVPEANRKLEQLRENALPGVQFAPPLHAHITLATWLPEDADAFMDACTEMSRDIPSLTIRYEKVEVLAETSIIVATPSVPAALVSLHNRIVDHFVASLDQWTRGSAWYPHSTLLYSPSLDLDAVCAEMQKYFVPFEARIDAIEFSRVEEKGYTVLNRIPLP